MAKLRRMQGCTLFGDTGAPFAAFVPGVQLIGDVKVCTPERFFELYSQSGRSRTRNSHAERSHPVRANRMEVIFAEPRNQHSLAQM